METWTLHRWALLGLVLANAIWGSTFVVAQDVTNPAHPTSLAPMRYIMVRFGLAVGFMLLIWGWRLRHIPAETVGHGVRLGIFLGLGYVLQAQGLAWSGSPSKAAFITGSSVLLVPLFGAWFGKQRPTAANLIGLVIAFVGFTLLCFPDDQARGWRWSDAVSFGCTVPFAIHIVLMERYAERSDVDTLNIVQLGVSVLVAAAGWLSLAGWAALGLPVPPVLAPELRPLSLTGRQAWELLYLVIFGTMICYRLQTWAQRHVSATQTALTLTLEPVFAALIAFGVGVERLGLRELAGGTLTIAGVVISELLTTAHGRALKKT
ncbi:MAG: DMT family transporter [Chloracidobacterium sp.]|uniref:DMT family transporter n=1 Tax=Chloracidobacterium validum TaxID=2821543 RepID=A0ABX8B644_9BACT|nr:DMT family transporter [Chloracidobacterium validum]QUW02119.1 DMT family transporter [Chloracidobacterium validum]